MKIVPLNHATVPVPERQSCGNRGLVGRQILCSKPRFKMQFIAGRDFEFGADESEFGLGVSRESQGRFATVGRVGIDRECRATTSFERPPTASGHIIGRTYFLEAGIFYEIFLRCQDLCAASNQDETKTNLTHRERMLDQNLNLLNQNRVNLSHVTIRNQNEICFPQLNYRPVLSSGT
jgi:hypothetical protein